MSEHPMTDDYLEQLPLVEQLRIVSLAEAVRLSGMSEDSLRRHCRDKFIKLSPRRVGMRLGDVLRLRAQSRTRDGAGKGGSSLAVAARVLRD